MSYILDVRVSRISTRLCHDDATKALEHILWQLRTALRNKLHVQPTFVSRLYTQVNPIHEGTLFPRQSSRPLRANCKLTLSSHSPANSEDILLSTLNRFFSSFFPLQSFIRWRLLFYIPVILIFLFSCLHKTCVISTGTKYILLPFIN